MPTQPSLSPHISTALQPLNYTAPVDLQYEPTAWRMLDGASQLQDEVLS